MQQFLIPQKKIVEPPNPPLIISSIVDEQQTLVDPSILQESLELRVATQVNQYLSLPKKLNPKPDAETTARAQWKELNCAILSATSRCQERLKNGPKFKYPHSILANLHEFNQLQYEFTMNWSKSLSVSAALSAAKSSIS